MVDNCLVCKTSSELTIESNWVLSERASRKDFERRGSEELGSMIR